MSLKIILLGLWGPHTDLMFHDDKISNKPHEQLNLNLGTYVILSHINMTTNVNHSHYSVVIVNNEWTRLLVGPITNKMHHASRICQSGLTRPLKWFDDFSVCRLLPGWCRLWDGPELLHLHHRTQLWPQHQLLTPLPPTWWQSSYSPWHK